jgi:hypothetical protein
VADIPEEFERILSQLLEKEPNRRIPNADILARRLEAMVQSLSVSSETLPADASWFLAADPVAPSEPAKAASSATDIPATLELSRAVEGGEGEKQSQEPFPDSVLLPEKEKDRPEAAPDAVSPVPGDASPASRFVMVSEDELGEGDEEEDRPPMFSWQTGALVIALLSVGFSVWWFLQPPTADALAARIEAKVDEDSIDSIRRAESDIREFLSRYSSDRRAKTYRRYQQQLELDDLQRSFDSPIKRLTGKKDLSPIERAYSEAMNYVRLDPEVGMAKLQAIVDLYGQADLDTGRSELCLILAGRRLTQLREEVKKRSAEQLSLLQNRLNAADTLWKSEPEQAKTMYRAVVELYCDKPWADDAVRRARKALKTPSPRRP